MEKIHDSTFLVKLPRKLRTRLHALAKKEGIPSAEYVRRLIIKSDIPKKGGE